MPAHEHLFDYPKDAVLITWRYGLTPLCMELTARHGNTLIMAPGEYTYLDYPQYKNDFPEFNNWGMPVTTLETAYQFDPGYGLPASQQAHIAGVNGTLWAEAMPDINRVTYMTYPRGLALARSRMDTDGTSRLGIIQETHIPEPVGTDETWRFRPSTFRDRPLSTKEIKE